MKVSIVIPAHNEEKRIGKVLKKILKQNLDVVVVDDGSTDNTYKVLQNFQFSISKKQASLISNFQLLRHRVNLGKGAAMKTGAEYAFKNGADAVIFMDSDGQHDASDLPLFVNKLKENRDSLIVGTRNLSYGVPLVRYVGNKFASLLVAFLFHSYVSDLLCGFRAMTKDTYKKIVWDSAGYAVETEMVINAVKKGVKVTEIPIRAVYLDSVKGVTILDAVNILVDVVSWRVKK